MSMPSAGLHPAIWESERPQTHALGWFYTSAQNVAFETLGVKRFYVLSTQQHSNRTLIGRPIRVGSSTRAFEQRVLVVC
jgi:hypothetical protein